MLLNISTPCRHSITPDLEFDYSDVKIHEDFYKLMKYSCDEIYATKEQSKKAMRLWSTFLEPMLSVPSRPPEPKDSDVMQSDGTDIKEKYGNPSAADPEAMNTESKTLPNGDVSPDLMQSGNLHIQVGKFDNYLDAHIPNVELIATAIGIVSETVDNVPLVVAIMAMYDLSSITQDSEFWQLVAYCASTGGSMLVIGSAAGVAFMGMEKVEFLWYLRKIRTVKIGKLSPGASAQKI